MNKVILAASVALTLGFAAAARAEVYDFSFTTSNGNSGVESATGEFTTGAEVGYGVYAITSASGSVNNSAITGLSPYADADNDYYTSSPNFSFGGLSFATASGVNYNLFSQNGAYSVISSAVDAIGYPQSGSPVVSLSVAPVPEPSTWLLMIAGIGGIAMMLRRARTSMGFRFKDAFSV